MADSAGELTFSFGADFSSFTREVDGAGRRLDALRVMAARSATGLASSPPLDLTGAMSRAQAALAAGRGTSAAPSADPDDASARTLSRLSDQLALLQSTGTAHDAIAARMRVEAEQAKLGTDATAAQKDQVAALVTEIDAAKTAQRSLAVQQGATNDAWEFGANMATRGLDAILLRGASLRDVARSSLLQVAHQGLSAAFTGGGLLAGLFGTAGQGGQVGGVFGALQGLFGQSLPGANASLGAINSAFSGLYANGGTVPAGRWGIVGEKGAEVVAGPATVTPWHKLPAAPPGRRGGHRRLAPVHHLQRDLPRRPLVRPLGRADGGRTGARGGPWPTEQLMVAFLETRFPTDVALGARGGPERRTDVVTLRSGAEQRNSLWADSRRKYQAGYGVKTFAQLEAVLHFFEACRGRLTGFRWKDRFDYRSCASPGSPSATDQPIGTGDGATAIFQLTKTYGGAAPYGRLIRKPVAGSVSVAVGGVPSPSTAWSLDPTTGLITFAAGALPPQGALVTAGYAFDVPVRFDTDYLEVDLSHFEAGQIPNIPIVEIRP